MNISPEKESGMAVNNSTAQSKEINLRQAVLGELYRDESLAQRDAIYTEDEKKIKDGKHRFDIHSGQAVFSRPQGFLVNREEDRKDRMERNAAAIKLWNNRYVEVTDDGFIVRENKKPKAKLKLVKSDGRQ